MYIYPSINFHHSNMSLVLKNVLQRNVPFTNNELEYVYSHFKELIIKKKQHLFLAGEICKLASYCEKGCFRKYAINDKGDEVVVDFAIEDYWVGDLASLINRTPTPYNFQALEDCTMQVMAFADWDRLGNEIPKFKEARRRMELKNHDTTMALLTFEKYATVEEKYIHLLKRFPGLPNRIPSIHIASYLGIKPESFSRLKRKFAGR